MHLPLRRLFCFGYYFCFKRAYVIKEKSNIINTNINRQRLLSQLQKRHQDKASKNNMGGNTHEPTNLNTTKQLNLLKDTQLPIPRELNHIETLNFVAAWK